MPWPFVQKIKIFVIKGAQTYCIINDGTSWLPKNAIGSCTIDKNSPQKFFYASDNTVLNHSTTCVPKSSRGFLELSVGNGENIRKELPSC